VYLPYPIDTRGVVAKLEDGILTVKANKLQDQGNVITIPVE
jgi:HSP20 family molecular chaperone IbpA